MDCRIVFVFLVAIVTVHKVSCLQCYQCFGVVYESSNQAVTNSLENQGEECVEYGSYFEESVAADEVTCASYENVCAKLSYEITYEYLGESVTTISVVRGCTYSTSTGCEDVFDDIQDFLGGTDVEVTGDAYNCYCDHDDFCNTASATGAVTLTVLLAALVTKLLN